MPKPLHAIKESYLTFELKGNSCFHTLDSGQKLNDYKGGLCTIFTQSNGCAWYKGDYILLSVQFKASGINAIFGIPQVNLVNGIFCVEDILGNETKILTEQLASYNNIFEMGALLNSYFTKKILQQKSKYYTNIIAHITNAISQNNGLISIDVIAHTCNMSIRTLERRFIDAVGIPVKLYARIARFHHTIDSKMLRPEKNWTEIAHENGYFDQSHLIKDFREFSSRSPAELFKYTPVPQEDIKTLQG